MEFGMNSFLRRSTIEVAFIIVKMKPSSLLKDFWGVDVMFQIHILPNLHKPWEFRKELIWKSR